jgi:ketosteroid isomerase-like protein
MNSDDAKLLREANKAAFLKLLGHLGRKEFDAFQACLAEDLVQEWPYRPLPSLPERVVGAAVVRRLIETGMSDFDPYNYRIQTIHDLVDPQVVIAEYSSHSIYRRRQVPYENSYISVLHFRDGKLFHWTEYVNPLIVKEALLDDFEKTPEQRTGQTS